MIKRPERGEVNGAKLSERETEVAHRVADGLTNRQIARLLGISEKTVETHLRNIFRKTGLASRAQLAVYITRSG